MTAPLADLHLSREFACSPSRLYTSFTEPAELAAWFGPEGMSVPLDTIEMDVRVGGFQRLTMVSEDGQHRAPIDVTFIEVVPDELLVGRESWSGVPGLQPPGLISMRMEFRPSETGCLLELTQGPMTAEVIEMTTGGWLSSFTKLDALISG